MLISHTIRSSVFGRHSHQHAYAALVLSGGYEEAGDLGRFQVKAGEVVLHDRFEAHINRFPGTGAVVLNLPLPADNSFSPGVAKVRNPDLIARLAEQSQEDAIRVLLTMTEARELERADWADELALELMENPSLNLTRWSEENGLAPWTVSRGFMRVFGLSPSAFRARMRARRAWEAVRTKEYSLTRIAAHLGFADQAHMSRSVKQLTGKCPREWRSCKWIQDAAAGEVVEPSHATTHTLITCISADVRHEP